MLSKVPLEQEWFLDRMKKRELLLRKVLLKIVKAAIDIPFLFLFCVKSPSVLSYNLGLLVCQQETMVPLRAITGYL